MSRRRAESSTGSMFNSGPISKEPHPGSRRHDPETSKEAAAKLDVNGLEKVVLQALIQAPHGLTTGEVAWYSDRDLVSISPRTGPLEKKELIRKTGKTRIPAGKHRRADVWEITARGIAWLRKNTNTADELRELGERQAAQCRSRLSAAEVELYACIDGLISDPEKNSAARLAVAELFSNHLTPEK